eukprot:Sspe_Gene.100087::Locus_74723_Transcript_2_2_Confidence_0.667_Length_1280::g.100087::m.100087
MRPTATLEEALLAPDDEKEVIEIFCGDRVFKTARSTLSQYPGSFLEALVSGRYPVQRDKEGHIFLDGNSEVFAEVLYFLQRGRWDPPRDPQKRERFLAELKYLGLLQYTPISNEANKWKLASPCEGCTVVVSQDGMNATKIVDQQGQKNSMVIGDTALTHGIHRWRVECVGLQEGKWIWCGVAPDVADPQMGDPWYYGWGWSTMGYENRGDVHLQNQVWEFKGHSITMVLEYNADSGVLKLNGIQPERALALRGLPPGLYPAFIFSRLNNSISIEHIDSVLD